MSEAASELLLFQVGSRIFAAQVDDVVRIAGGGAAGALERTALGEPFARDRGIVVSCGDREATLAVDTVLGVRSVPERDLHPLPPLAATLLRSEAITGFAVIDEAPTLLIDLPTLVREERRRDADPEESRPDDA